MCYITVQHTQCLHLAHYKTDQSPATSVPFYRRFMYGIMANKLIMNTALQRLPDLNGLGAYTCVFMEADSECLPGPML